MLRPTAGFLAGEKLTALSTHPIPPAEYVPSRTHRHVGIVFQKRQPRTDLAWQPRVIRIQKRYKLPARHPQRRISRRRRSRIHLQARQLGLGKLPPHTTSQVLSVEASSPSNNSKSPVSHCARTDLNARAMQCARL
jgi:hypothetical protein